MYPCNRGEMLTRSVHENAANRMLAIRTRAPVCERPELFICPRACDNGWVCARNFLGSAPASRAVRGASPRTISGYPAFNASHPTNRLARAPIAGRRGDRSPVMAVPQRTLISGFRGRCDSSLERNAMTGSRRLRGRACADLLCPFGVLVVWVLI